MRSFRCLLKNKKKEIEGKIKPTTAFGLVEYLCKPSWLATGLLLLIVFFFTIFMGDLDIYNHQFLEGFRKKINTHIDHLKIETYVFALLIFIATLSISDETKDRVRVFLKVTMIFPLLILSVFSFIPLFFSNEVVCPLLYLIFINLLMFCSVIRLFNVIFYRKKYLEERTGFLVGKLEDSLIDETSFLLSVNDFEMMFKKNPDISYKEFDFMHKKDKGFLIKSKSAGVVFDINLKLISNLVHSLKKDRLRLNLLVGIDSYISEGTPLAQVNTESFSNKRKDEVEDFIIKAVVIKENKFKKSSIEEELVGVRNQFSKAIKNKEFATIDECVMIYSSLIQATISFQLKNDLKFTCDVNQRILGLHWPYIYAWINSDFLFIYNEAVNSDNLEILQHTVKFQSNIFKYAAERKDLFLLKLAFTLQIKLYHFSKNKLKEVSEDLKRKMLYEIEYSIILMKEKTLSENDTKEIFDLLLWFSREISIDVAISNLDLDLDLDLLFFDALNKIPSNFLSDEDERNEPELLKKLKVSYFRIMALFFKKQVRKEYVDIVIKKLDINDITSLTNIFLKTINVKDYSFEHKLNDINPYQTEGSDFYDGLPYIRAYCFYFLSLLGSSRNNFFLNFSLIEDQCKFFNYVLQGGEVSCFLDNLLCTDDKNVIAKYYGESLLEKIESAKRILNKYAEEYRKNNVKK